MEKRDEKTSEENNINSNGIEKESKISNESDQNPKRPDDGEGDKGKNQNPNETEQKPNDSDEDEDGEEEECGFCLFMKSGGCRDAFIAWEKCVEEGEANNQDIVEKCYKVTSLLKDCMDSHADYYAPVLRAEKEMEEQVAEEMKEHDKEATKGESASQGIATIEVPNEITEVPNPTIKVIIPQEN
ncbi:hypothetical protein SUGI_1173090 [Cryptomeria japonica]|uniref:uncharacterized protein LOC131068356 n=1 Tax=Cryptomeria japonica TaxID=3369 RepID=UPI0024148AB6|nr:uncharacterized protein LOC131068356 [Cryptomeria japonica]GLJ54606.1 hypothetical protein SUGI_1173090 [Cryptomeria japonica]